MKSMKRNSRRLFAILMATLAVAIAIIVVYETNILTEGAMYGDANVEFLVIMIMELLTICVIPIALRMFRFSIIRNYIEENGLTGHFRMASARMMLLAVPLLLNVLFYYLFMKVMFAYLAIILAISLIFIIPTVARCELEQ